MVAVAAELLQLACQHQQQDGAGNEALRTRRQHLGDAQEAESQDKGDQTSKANAPEATGKRMKKYMKNVVQESS